MNYGHFSSNATAETGWSFYVYVHIGEQFSPPPSPPTPRVSLPVARALGVLGFVVTDFAGKSAAIALRQVNARYRRLAKELHPDAGGDEALMKALNASRDLLVKVIAASPS